LIAKVETIAKTIPDLNLQSQLTRIRGWKVDWGRSDNITNQSQHRKSFV
jgi:hypothetical protein